MRSTLFEVDRKDNFQIGSDQYAGEAEVDTIISRNFTVAFQSYLSKKKKGFVLNWICLTWSEWTRTGTCTEVKTLQPEYTGPDFKYRTKYRKTNETCGKNIHFEYAKLRLNLVTGVVKLSKEDKQSTIMSDCKSVHILSTRPLKKKENVFVGDIKYERETSLINQVVSTNFTISMESDDSISFHFNCTQWGEWHNFQDDGTCRTSVMRPLQNGKKSEGFIKYKFNETCRKFSFLILTRTYEWGKTSPQTTLRSV